MMMTTPTRARSVMLVAAACAAAASAWAPGAHADPAPPPPTPPMCEAAPCGVADPQTGDILNGGIRQHITFASDITPVPGFLSDTPGQTVWRATMDIHAITGDVTPVIPFVSCINDAGRRYQVWWQHGSPEGKSSVLLSF